jgi:O-antigen/teichoic acid export membrane protein
MNLDNMLVGKILGFAKLGLYAVAFNISNFISDYFGNKVYRVTYPAYSKLQNDLEALRSAYLKVIKHIAIIATPFCFGILVLGGQFLRVAYGEKWLGAAGVMKMLAFAGLFNAITTSNEAILLAQGKSKISFWIYFVQVALFLIFIKPAAHLFDLYGIGIVVSGASFFAMFFSFYRVSQGLSLNFKQVYLSFRPSLVCSLLMSLILVIAQGLLAMSGGIAGSASPHTSFILLFVLAIVSYAFLIYKTDAMLFSGVKKMAFS